MITINPDVFFSEPTVNFTNIQNLQNLDRWEELGEGNIDEAPLFDFDKGDGSLSSDSNCIDAGTHINALSFAKIKSEEILTDNIQI